MPDTTVLQRLCAKIALPSSPGGCWEWLGGKSRGYGYFTTGAKQWRAARFVYELFVGPIPPGLELDHLCRNTACVRPDHLEPVTGRVNNERRAAAQTECLRGHPFDATNTARWRGSRRHCRTCQREAHRRYRSLNPEHYRAKGREYARRVRAKRAAR